MVAGQGIYLLAFGNEIVLIIDPRQKRGSLLSINLFAQPSAALKLEPASAIRNKAVWARITFWSALGTLGVRILHVYHDKWLWAYPLLVGELAIAELR